MSIEFSTNMTNYKEDNILLKESMYMAELKAGEWPISEIDPKVIDLDGLYLPRDPRDVAESEQDITRGSKDLYQSKFRPPFSAVSNDYESNVDPRAGSSTKTQSVGDKGDKEAKGPVSKHAAANRDHAKDGERNQGTEIDIIDEYINKKPKEEMLESMSMRDLEKLLEAEEAEINALIDDANPEDVDSLLTNIPPQSISDPVSDEEYDSSEDDEIATALDTFEHAHEPPQPKEGPIEDILSQKGEIFTEAAGGKGELDRFFIDNPDAVDKDTKEAWKQYIHWADNLGIERAWGETFKRKHMVAKNPARAAAASSSRGSYARPAPLPPKANVSAEEFEDFSDMLGSFHKATPEELKPTLTAEEKYDQLMSKVYEWATTPMTEFERDVTKQTTGSKRHIMICGSPGIGKTFHVKESVLQAVKEGIDFKTQYVRGTIGKSVSNVMAFLYRFRQGYLIIFDDCDDFLDSDLGNVMKGVFELDAPVTNTGSVGVRRAAMKNVSELEDQPLTENFIRSYLLKEAGVRDDVEIDEDDMPEDDIEVEDEDSEESKEELLPARISFQSRILFISNKKREKIDAAVRSRLSIVELYLAPEEIVNRIKKLLPQLLKNERSVPADRLQWAKLNALRWLELTVKADGRPIEFPGGRTLQLPFDANSTVLEFRTYIDLVSGWLAQAKKYERSHPKESLMKSQKLPMEFLRGFLIGELIPILKDAAMGGGSR